jgi:hypothetical protein
VVAPCIVGRRWIRSVTDVAPLRSISSRRMICTGSAPSASTRLMAEPVTSTRWGVSWAWEGAANAPPSASTTAMLTFVFLNMLTPLPKKG